MTCLESQSITTFAGLFAQKADDGYVTIDIGDCGTGGGAAVREDFLFERRPFPEYPHP